MKLASLVLITILGASGAARADEQQLQPPGGPVLASDDQPAPPMQRGQRGARGKQLRRSLLETFDANGDGRLGPRERMRAIRVLRRIEMRLAGAERGAERKRGARRFIQRYDMNGDGNLGPREMPRGQADRLRRLDRDRDGWVEPREY